MSDQLVKCSVDDKEDIWNLVSYAYGVPDSSREAFLERLDIIAKEFYIFKHDNEPVATARMLPFEQNIRGVMKPMGGVGMVASSPEHRREGFVRELMLGMLRDLKEQGYATSTLYPFKDTFYMALGYAKMPMSRILEVDPQTLTGVSMPDGYSVKRESGDDMFKLWRDIHEEMVGQTHGAVRRNDDRWNERTSAFRAKAAVARNSEGEPEGIMTYGIKGYGEGHAWSETGQLNMGDFHWKTIEGRDAILHFLYKHADQIAKVNILINSRTEDYYHWMRNIHTPVLKSSIFNMARIVDVKTSFENLPVHSVGSLVLKIVDPHFEWNNGVFKFVEEDGALKVEETKEVAKSTLTIEGLTAILYGTLDLHQLRRLGWLHGDASEFTGTEAIDKDGTKYRAIVNLEDWFPRATPWLTEDF